MKLTTSVMNSTGRLGAAMLASLSLALTCPPGVQAAFTLLQDDFSDGDRTANPSWYKVGVQTNFEVDVVDDSAGIGAGNAMRLDFTAGRASTASSAALVSFSPVTLASPGDYIQIEFDLNYITTQTGAVGNALRFGFFDANGTSPTSDGVNTAAGPTDSDDGFGYGVTVDGVAASGAVAEFYRFRPNLGVFNTNFAMDSIGSSSNADLIIQPGVQKISLRIEYATDAGADPADLRVTFSRGGFSASALMSSKFDSADTFTFGDFNIGNRGDNLGNDDLIIDNVLITTNVPEPSAWVLVALGLLGGAIRRRAA